MKKEDCTILDDVIKALKDFSKSLLKNYEELTYMDAYGSKSYYHSADATDYMARALVLYQMNCRKSRRILKTR